MLLLALPALACYVPTDGEVLATSVTFCPDVLYLRSPIVISGDDFVVDCNGAVLTGLKSDVGVRVIRATNVTVANCSVVGHGRGFVVQNSSDVLLLDNNLVRNHVGVSLLGVFDSSVYDKDVSLYAPFEVVKSERNALSLSNKPVRGDFCRVNFCDESRAGVLLNVQPRISKREMGIWLSDGVTGRSVENRFKAWVFGGLF